MIVAYFATGNGFASPIFGRKKTMKTFKGNKSLSEIREACEKRGWHYDQSGFDNGGDWVNFDFRHGEEVRRVVFNTFNGTFLIKDGADMISERSTELDDVPWYAALLEFIYEMEEGAAA